MKKIYNFRNSLSIMYILTVLVGCQTKNNSKMNSLDEIINKHFNAIKNRNIDNLLKTVNNEKITLILPNGNYSKSIDHYKKVNTDWFADQNWNIEYDIIDKIINKETGIILAKIAYFDKDEDGKEYSFQYYLTLIFNLNKNKWELMFDQNTIIR